MRLHGVGQGPVDGVRIVNVDILVDHDGHLADEFLRQVVQDARRVVVLLAADAHQADTERAGCLREVDFLHAIETRRLEVIEAGGCPADAADLGRFTRRELRQKGLINRLLAHGDCRDFHEPRVVPRGHVSRELAERAFHLLNVGRHEAFDHDLRLRRHQQVMRHALCQFDRLAGQAAGHVVLLTIEYRQRHNRKRNVTG